MSHCTTCTCDEVGISERRWLTYDPKDDNRDSSSKGNCSSCKDVLQRGDRNVVMVTGTTRRYFCEADALNAGWDGTYTSTVADALIQARVQMEAGVITPEKFMEIVDAYS